MRVLFTVQGEGRGHMTQALAIRQLLRRSGHELVGVVIGGTVERPLPEFVTRELAVTVTRISSPTFQLRGGRGVHLPATIWRTLAGHRDWRASVVRLRGLIEELRPDLVINFFEPVTGIAQLTGPLDVPVVSVAHQHMIGRSPHRTPLSGLPDELSLRGYSDLVGWRSWKLALSFYPAPDRPRQRFVVGPPLLRRELFELAATRGDYYLLYILNHGYYEEIRRWQRAHPDVSMHVFYDRPGAPAVEAAAPGLTFHTLSGEKFLRYMAGCRAVACTAGFESVCEAAWLDKPLFIVPVEHHAEQRWNARDATRAGLATTAPRFDLDRLFALPNGCDNAWFRDWVATAEAQLLRVIDAAVNARAKRAIGARGT